jgi:hypothetical protein
MLAFFAHGIAYKRWAALFYKSYGVAAGVCIYAGECIQVIYLKFVKFIIRINTNSINIFL